MKKNIINIGFDARLAGTKHAGLGRYGKNMCLWLPLVTNADYHFVYFIADKTVRSELMAQWGQIPLAQSLTMADLQSRIEWVVAPFRHYSWAEQRQWPALLREYDLDILHVPHFNVPYFCPVSKLVVTIHDLLWHEKKGLQVTTLPAWQYGVKYLGYKLVVRRAVQQACKIIVPSQTIKQTVDKFYPDVEEKIKVIYNGVSDWSQVQAELIDKQLPDNYLLYVGSLYPHKNIEIVLQALKADASLSLVIVSARDAFWQETQRKIKSLGVDKQVFFVGQVRDGQLKTLYQQAGAVVQPSLSEGFGLTGVEAMQLGVPVLASEIAIFREIYGQAYISFQPESLASFQQAIAQWRDGDKKRWRELGLRQAQAYSWQECVRQVVQVYREVERQV